MPMKGSISFLKKRNKKLLFYRCTRPIPEVRTRMSKSFLVLFFKKELLFYRLPSFCGESLSMPIGMIPTALSVDLSRRPTRRANQPP
jgi:hypothetical protein